MKPFLIPLLIFFTFCSAHSFKNQSVLEIKNDTNIEYVKQKALEIVGTGFNAGDNYGEVWIRDYNTFIELASEVHNHEDLKENIRIFFRFQGDDGNIIDGFIPIDRAAGGYDYIYSDLEPRFAGHKNTVETDHESSLIQTIYKYVTRTGDYQFLEERVDGIRIADRMLLAVEFLINHRMSEKYGLIWGATTADWGDVQPEHEWGVFITDDTHFAVEVYDNAMFLIALQNLAELLPDHPDDLMEIHDQIAVNVMNHLWDEENQQFVPHRYLDGSPFPDDFNEDEIYQHGGTAVAIEAGLLSSDQVYDALQRMRKNVQSANAASIGLTLYPPYPEGYFLNPSMVPYGYQNGGDWTWFGGRMIQQLIRHGYVEEAYEEALPMIERVVENDGFYEWYTRDNEPMGSGTFRGSAGVLYKAIEMFEEYADEFEKKDWRDITTVEDIWIFYPDKLRHMFTSLDFSNPELDHVITALNSADTIAAGKALIEYYKNGNHWITEGSEKFAHEEERQKAMELLSDDKVTLRDFTVEIPKNEDEGWQWDFTGPENDDEFGYELNRHLYFLPLLKGWNETGDDKFAQKFDKIIRDWTIHNPLPEKNDRMWVVHRTTTQELDWRDIGEVIWRDLEAGIRLGESWLPAFFGFQQANSFTPAGRLLMLHSILIQAEYLRDYHKNNHNWTTMEMNGLGLTGLVFPEFEKAEEWIDYALTTMEKEINGQVYPDGTQTEISTLTQQVALERFELLAENFQKAGRDVPERYLNRIEDMYNYLAYSIRPDGHQPLNNDSDRDNLRPLVLKGAEKFSRKDWNYIATNGNFGGKPEGHASKVFPWAGLHFMRSGWDVNSHWAIFDTGPFGTGHQHSDMLHLSIHAHGRDLIVDSGRYTHDDYFSFNPENWRGYFRSSFSHNVILVDGKGQGPGPFRAEEPLEEGIDYVNTNTFDYAIGTFSYGFADGINYGFSQDNVIEAGHTRALFYVKDKYWVVVDRIETDVPRTIEVLWNHAPDVNAFIEGNQIVSNDSETGNLRIVPVGDMSWNIDVVKGQTDPFIRGWYSETYGNKVPNPAVVYTADIEGDEIFAWILVPAFGPPPEVVNAELLDKKAVKLSVQIENEEPMTMTVPLSANYRPNLDF